MKIITLCLSVVAASFNALYGQYVPKVYWAEKPPVFTVSDKYNNESAVIIEDNSVVKYTDEGKDVWMHLTVHRVVKVLDEKGVESFNKLSFPLYSNQELEEIKARTILPDGRVFDVAKDNIKEAKNEDGSREMAFALEGVQKNAIIEFFVVYKKPAVYFGREVFQLSLPVLHASLDIQSPERLQVEEKGYNGFPTVTDTLVDGTRYIYAEVSNLAGIPRDETYSYPDLYTARAEYKVSYLPLEKGKVRVFTWQEMVKKLYASAYDFSDKETKAVAKFLTAAGVSDADDVETKIRKIESNIKNSITMYKYIEDDNAWKLDVVLSKKAATEGSLVRLFIACFQQTDIKHEFGMAPNRQERTIDDDFENWGSLENYVFYFPSTKKFLSPASVYYRYPFTTTDIIDNKALFCKLTTIGDVTSALTDIRTVTPLSATQSSQDINAVISFNADMEATAEVSYGFKGYCAMGMREYAVLLPKDKVKELVQTIASIAEKPEYVLKYTITGEAFDDYYGNKPMTITTSLKTPQLVEKAGAKYMLKIGDVIGRQTELYQTAERKHPIDIPYPHYLNRTITVNIPEGYRILNPEETQLNVVHKDSVGTATCGFQSTYKLNGNQLVVNITEFYTRLHYPASEYEPYRKVINAAADFNKVTLLLSK